MSTDTFKEWTPAVPLKHPDTLISSEYTSAKTFRPSYEKDDPCMEQLMANEYQRLWLAERDEWLRKIAAANEEKKRPYRAIDVKDHSTKSNAKSSSTPTTGRRKSGTQRGNSEKKNR